MNLLEKRKIMTPFLIFLFLFIFLPTVIYGDPGQGTIFGITYECNNGNPGECGFEDLVAATVHVINYATGIALGLSVIVLAYAGFDYMMSEGNAGKLKQA